MSYFLNPENFTDRLRKEWDQYGGLIIAVDFDSTLIPFWDYEQSTSYEPVRQLIRDCKDFGCTIIINTAAAEERIKGIKFDLAELNIPWDYFNESPPFIKGIGKGSKVYANAYLDDRGGLNQVYNTLLLLVTERKALMASRKADLLLQKFG